MLGKLRAIVYGSLAVVAGRVTGTMRGIENVTGPGERYVCESGDVSFSAG